MTKKAELNWDVIDSVLSVSGSLNQVRYALESKGIIVTTKTIQRHIREKFDQSFDEYREFKLGGTKIKLQQQAIKMGLGGHPTMLIFCLKNLCGWTDKQEISGPQEIKLNYKLGEESE